MDFPGGTSGKESACQCWKCKRHRFSPWVGKIPWRRKWQLTLLAWRIPRTGAWRLRSIGLQRVRHEWALEHRPRYPSNIWNRLSSHQNSKSLSKCSFSQKWNLCFTHTPTAIAHPYLRKITASHHAFTAHPLLVPHLLSWPSVHALHVFCTLRSLNFFGEWHFPGPGSSLAPCLSMIMKYFKVSVSSLKEDEVILIASSYKIKRTCCTLTEAVTVCVVSHSVESDSLQTHEL